MAFGGPVAHLVGSGQAFVAVANNPGDWVVDKDGSAPSRPARALFGHPGLGQQTRFVQPGDPVPGVALLRLDSAQITWVPGACLPTNPAQEGARAPLGGGARPAWVTGLTTGARCVPSSQYGAEQVALRHAAVLVLLTEGPQGPQVLLTERSNDLTDYPGQIVFPGGVADASDAGPVATALREAKEEVGLDVDQIRVIGCLPPLALPDTGFLVHPVLAWCEHAPFIGSVNYAEVAAVFEMPVGNSRDRDGLTSLAGRDGSGFVESGPLGTVTGAVIDMLISELPRGNPRQDSPRSADNPRPVAPIILREPSA